MIKKYLKNPFKVVQEKQLFLFGTIALILASFLQLFTYSRSISILKIASVSEVPQWWEVSLDAIITTLCMAIPLFVLGKIINKKTRFIDILNTVLIARIPLIIAIISDLNGYLTSKINAVIQNINNPEAISQQMNDLIPITIISISSLLALVAFGYYIYQGFKTATHLKKALHIIIFVILVLLSDLLTRLITTLY